MNVRVNNLNEDLAGDIQRAVPDAIVQYYQGLGHDSPMRVVIADHQMLGRPIELYQYSGLPIIILVLTVAGIMAAGLAVAGEFQRGTIKEVLLAPISRLTVMTGKILAGFISTSILATAVLAVSAAFNLTRPEGLRFWADALVTIALASAFAAGLGISVGIYTQRKQPVSVFGNVVAVELFALAGGIGVIWFEPVWLQRIAAWDPLAYSIHSLQESVFYQSSDGFVRDVVVLAGVAALAVLAGSLAMRRELRTQ